MKIENHILDILQLYEYAMAIGKTLDYNDNCEGFLKLILKRKNLNAAWILETDVDKIFTTYSIPSGQVIKTDIELELQDRLDSITDYSIFEYNDQFKSISPISVSGGYFAVYRLCSLGYLFLYSKKQNFSEKLLNQLLPVINKFYNSLRACKAFEQQQKLLTSLELRNQEISEYAHMISHDLKSPLRSIDTLSTWFKEDYAHQLKGDANSSFTLIRENVEKMDKLLNGILQYSTINKNQESSYVVDLGFMVEEITKNISWPEHIEFKVPNKLPLVIGDRYRLEQLFKHLIDNAIKYNDKDKGLIVLNVEDVGEFFKFSIQDNGIGISEKYHKKIFNTFKKLNNNSDSLGIGLSVVKRIVNMYHGDIWIDSEVGKGTTFYFTLKK